MNYRGKTLLTGERWVGRKEAALLPRLKKLLVELMDSKKGMRRNFPLIKVKRSGCWEWGGVVTQFGYCQMSFNGRSWLVHKFMYERLVREVHLPLCLDHLCRNRKCCNPLHLEEVTLGENVRRGNGVCGRNFRKTHCPKGHPLYGENLYETKEGYRHCKECGRNVCREWARIRNGYYKRHRRTHA